MLVTIYLVKNNYETTKKCNNIILKRGEYKFWWYEFTKAHKTQ